MPILNAFDLYYFDKNGHFQQFNKETRCVIGLFEHHFPRYKNEHFKKINIMFHSKECAETLEELKSRLGNPLCIDGFGEIETALNLDKYIKSDSKTKKKLTLEYLEMGLEPFIEQFHLERELFINTFNKVSELNYINEGIWKKTKLNPSKQLRAKILWQHDIDSFTAIMIIEDKKKNEMMRQELFKEVPSEFIFGYHFGEIVWFNDKEVALKDRLGNREWRVTI
ncbi:hypothetical protein RYX56_14880 [Alkalihalophilus lindianensis]|uniref:Uncharacterized protein n=1 Tax=Alkalihalophilus lindianensis TaxID=1630542 RepID=A0ABU3XCN5_9BACI|nr:hypothetical protein [Alkalihalophilus lindianensis]MDV2685647.1 hypothetical protein [Alkalihalophilus lindianensis]